MDSRIKVTHMFLLMEFSEIVNNILFNQQAGLKIIYIYTYNILISSHLLNVHYRYYSRNIFEEIICLVKVKIFSISFHLFFNIYSFSVHLFLEKIETSFRRFRQYIFQCISKNLLKKGFLFLFTLLCFLSYFIFYINLFN